MRLNPFRRHSVVYDTGENQLLIYADRRRANVSDYTHMTYKHHMNTLATIGRRLAHAHHRYTLQNGLLIGGVQRVHIGEARAGRARQREAAESGRRAAPGQEAASAASGSERSTNSITSITSSSTWKITVNGPPGSAGRAHRARGARQRVSSRVPAWYASPPHTSRAARPSWHEARQGPNCAAARV